MDISFLGATQTVTGSKSLVNSNAGKWLVDCGLYQGYKNLRLRNWDALPFDVNTLDGIVLTHAHLDHSGYLPVLYRQGYRGRVYCSEATAEFCKLLLPDSGHIMEEDAYFSNKHGTSRHQPALPLYTQKIAEQALSLLHPIAQGETLTESGMRITLKPAGHILGACSVYLNDGKCCIGFSGDLGSTGDSVMRPPEPPMKVDYLVVESTYGDCLQQRSNIKQNLATVVNRCSKNGGTLLIPSFAVGRAQLIMHLIIELKKERKVPDLPVFLDSPMAINASEIYCRFHPEHRLTSQQCHDMSSGVTYTRTVDQSMALVANNYPKIIISASGMATGGRVLHHLKKLLPDHRNTVLLVGYQAGGTRGDRLVRGERSVKIHGQYRPVKCNVEMLHGLSAHADQRELMDWLLSAEVAPKCLFINHGDSGPADALRLKVEETMGWNVHIPYYNERINLE